MHYLNFFARVLTVSLVFAHVSGFAAEERQPTPPSASQQPGAERLSPSSSSSSSSSRSSNSSKGIRREHKGLPLPAYTVSVHVRSEEELQLALWVVAALRRHQSSSSNSSSSSSQ